MTPLQAYSNGLVDHLGRLELSLKHAGAAAEAAGVRSCIVIAIRMYHQLHPEDLPPAGQNEPGAAIAAMARCLCGRSGNGAA